MMPLQPCKSENLDLNFHRVLQTATEPLLHVLWSICCLRS